MQIYVAEEAGSSLYKWQKIFIEIEELLLLRTCAWPRNAELAIASYKLLLHLSTVVILVM